MRDNQHGVHHDVHQSVLPARRGWPPAGPRGRRKRRASEDRDDPPDGDAQRRWCHHRAYLEEREFVDNTLAEVTWNYHAQASDGTVCYFGEDVDVYENGTITHAGAWCGVGPNQPGIFVPANPQVGMEFQMEVAPGVAHDEGRIVGSGPVTVPFGRFTNTIRIREFNPLDAGKDYKVLAAGVGFVIDGSQVLTDINQTSGAPPQPSLTLIACGT